MQVSRTSCLTCFGEAQAVQTVLLMDVKATAPSQLRGGRGKCAGLGRMRSSGQAGLAWPSFQQRWHGR